MQSQRPYFIRAIHEWVCDNNWTPYLLVDTSIAGVFVPLEYAQDGQIVLNVSPAACQNLSLDNEVIEFSARFAGQPRQLYVPVSAVLAIYAKENGQGMFFDPEDFPPVDNDPKTTPKPERPGSDGSGSKPDGKRPQLKVVK